MASQFQPVCVADFEKFAYETLPRNALDYYRSGANNQETLGDNVKAFIRYDIGIKDKLAVYQFKLVKSGTPFMIQCHFDEVMFSQVSVRLSMVGGYLSRSRPSMSCPGEGDVGKVIHFTGASVACC